MLLITLPLINIISMPYIEQMYTSCLAEAAYYVESNGEALIVDPMRETQSYIDKAKERGAVIKYVLETHFHADFVSGHVDLANKTGAEIIYGPGAETSYSSKIAKDGEVIKLGDIEIKVLHTPGHTLESSCYLVHDTNKEPIAIFTGDTLFIGDVGRPDLAIKSDLTKEDLAGMLYDSLRLKIMTLPDTVIVYPAHGAGSACGKNMSSETFDTLGNQKKFNYALQDISKTEFVKELTEGIMPAPQYFAANALLNKKGYSNLDELVLKSQRALSLQDFQTAWDSDTVVLDTRSIGDFPKGYIPGSMFAGLDGMYASWVATLLGDLSMPLLLIVDPGREKEAVVRLARVGFDNVVGYLEGGFATWEEAELDVYSFEEVTADELAELNKDKDLSIVDVRKPGEYDQSHVCNAEAFPLDNLMSTKPSHLQELKTYVYCKGGYRSLIASSILAKAGYKDIVNVKGGFDALKKTKISCTTPLCNG